MTRQLKIFNNETENKPGSNFALNFDGASRNNPGQAGAGIYILKNRKHLYSAGFYLGIKTNNQAEYLALILGLLYLKDLLEPEDSLTIISDSELIVRQITGKYKVRDPKLKSLFNVVMTILKDVNYKISHVLREKNIEADQKANEAIDNKLSIPNKLIDLLHEHDITV